MLFRSLAINKFLPGFRKLSDVIGKCAYIPLARLKEGLPVKSGSNYVLDRYETIKRLSGVWIVPLPHPSGVSLWPNKPGNKILIGDALQAIRNIREDYDI